MTIKTDRLEGAGIAVIAGNGLLPEMLAGELKRRGNDPFIVGLEAEAGGWIKSYRHCSAKTVEISAVLKRLRQENIQKVVLAGGVKSRPDFRSVPLNWLTISSIPKIYAALRKGDDGLLRFVMGLVARQGFSVIGAHEIMPDLLASAGTATDRRPGAQDWADLSRAHIAARELGRLDIGQAAVAVAGRVVAVEGAEGTEGLLQRVKELRQSGRISKQPSGVLVKTAKPGQDMRADLPSIGPQTIDQISDAGLLGIAVGADSSLILDFEETIRRANQKNVFVTGIDMKGEQ